MNGAKTFFESWPLNNRLLRSSGPLKIRLLQCYIVLWIPIIDAICRSLVQSSLYEKKFTLHKLLSNFAMFLTYFPKVCFRELQSIYLFCRFFREEDCISKCKDAKKSDKKKKVVCEDSAPICDQGCSLKKDDEGACLKCHCQKKGKLKSHIHSIIQLYF